MTDFNVQQAGRASGFVDNWQGGKTLAQCNLHMLDTEDSCDVTFRVGSSGHVIKAHRYVLISRSCVFYSMFTGPLAEKSDVTVPDIEPGDFKTFLFYIYTDSTTVDADNVTALLYASRKYAITALESQCLEFLEKHLNADNACVILDAAHRFDQRHLCQRALTVIQDAGGKSLKSAGFLALSHVLVDQIVESDDLAAEEHVVFNAVNSWAEAECGRQGREITPDTKRSVLGDTLVKVRFPLLKQTFIAKEVKACGLLTDLERLRILENIICLDNDVTPFKTKRRQRRTPHSITRFQNETDAGWNVNGIAKDAISFQCSQNAMLYGYKLYGPVSESEPTTYSVTTYFGSEENVLHSTIQHRTDFSVNSKVFDVAFEEPADMTAGVWYTLVVFIKGRETLKGLNGKEELLCPGSVKFLFQRSKHSTNGTDVDIGQIPSLLYRIT
ncbi:BTB/POZ domain-containing protein 6-like [Haliotis asinina]|uniref:BTB/POZ domain-containing protein 6-like n=1 Tax=Haliotis asinina TaxID=109174 RepID=UPI00353275E3